MRQDGAAATVQGVVQNPVGHLGVRLILAGLAAILAGSMAVAAAVVTTDLRGIEQELGFAVVLLVLGPLAGLVALILVFRATAHMDATTRWVKVAWAMVAATLVIAASLAFLF